MNAFVTHLQTRLTQPLPGWRMQIRMAPQGRQGTPDFTIKPDVKKGSVLLALYPDADDLQVVFTLRGKHLNSHGGQISFPGGRIEPNETVQQAALREAAEETGIAANSVTLLGALSELYIPPSNSLVYPQVGYLTQAPAFTPQVSEVDEIFTVPLSRFVEPDARGSWERVLHDGKNYTVPLWHIHPTTPLWGATAIVMSEFVALYEEYLGIPAFAAPQPML